MLSSPLTTRGKGASGWLKQALPFEIAQRPAPRSHGQLDVVGRVCRRDQATTPAFEIDTVIEHRDPQQVEHRLVAALQCVRCDRARIESGRPKLLAAWIGMDVEERVLAVDRPRYALGLEHVVDGPPQSRRGVRRSGTRIRVAYDG